MTQTQIAFGCNKKSDTPEEHVNDIFSNVKDDDFTAVKKDVLASQSKFSRQKPNLPEFTKDPEYRHGVSTQLSSTAKHLIYAATTNCEKENNRNEPGQQKQYQYNWPVDPQTTVFGVKNELENRSGSDGVSQALIVEDQDESVTDAPSRIFDSEQIFGKSTTLNNCNSSTAECLKIETDFTQQEDIGRSLTPGFRNATTTRTFGIPTIRTDIPKYERLSVADRNNYGDDTDASSLLRPSIFSVLGLDEDEFAKPRSKEYLKRLFINCGLCNDNVFEDIFISVSGGGNIASISSLKVTLETQQ